MAHASHALVKRAWRLRRTERLTAGFHESAQDVFPDDLPLLAQSGGFGHNDVFIGVQLNQLVGQLLPDACLRQGRPERHHQQKPDDALGHKVPHAWLFLLHIRAVFHHCVNHVGGGDLRKDPNTDLFTDLVIEIDLA